MKYRTRIVGTGSGFPQRVMKNAEFEAFVDTTDDWIRTRTGIETRRIADPAKGESTLSLAEEASRRALEMAGISGSEVDIVLVGTITPDTVMPTVANVLQDRLGAKRAFSFDFQAACSGWVYGLAIADHFLKAGGPHQTALVVGVETLSTVLNWKDRTTCVLFGDGAGATVLRRVDGASDSAILGTLLGAGGGADLLCIKHGYSRVPPYAAEYRQEDHKIKMQGAEIFKLATRTMVESSRQILAENKLGVEDVDFFLFHQANIRIIDHCAKALGIDPKKTWVNVQKYGNTSAATLPVALDEAWRAGAVKPGQLVLMATFGGGLTWGSALVRL